MFWVIILIALGFLCGYVLGKKTAKGKIYWKYPEEEGNLNHDEIAMLTFTQKERYALGKAMVLGNATEKENAFKNLEKAIRNISNIALEAELSRNEKVKHNK